jgi:hypothetical protein
MEENVGFSDIPAETDLDRLYRENAEQADRIVKLTAAVNEMGARLQWIIDRVDGIFQMFGSPQMTAMLPGMMAGAMGAASPDKSYNPNTEEQGG